MLHMEAGSVEHSKFWFYGFFKPLFFQKFQNMLTSKFFENFFEIFGQSVIPEGTAF